MSCHVLSLTWSPPIHFHWYETECWQEYIQTQWQCSCTSLQKQKWKTRWVEAARPDKQVQKGSDKGKNHRQSCATVHHMTLQYFFVKCTCSPFQQQFSRPRVDQDSLCGTRGAPQHSLSQQGSILRDLQRVEVYTQWLLAACAVTVVNLIHNTLEDRIRQSFVLYLTSPNLCIIALLSLPVCRVEVHQSGRSGCYKIQSLWGGCAFPVHHSCTCQRPWASRFGWTWKMAKTKLYSKNFT